MSSGWQIETYEAVLYNIMYSRRVKVVVVKVLLSCAFWRRRSAQVCVQHGLGLGLV